MKIPWNTSSWLRKYSRDFLFWKTLLPEINLFGYRIEPQNLTLRKFLHRLKIWNINRLQNKNPHISLKIKNLHRGIELRWHREPRKIRDLIREIMLFDYHLCIIPSIIGLSPARQSNKTRSGHSVTAPLRQNGLEDANGPRVRGNLGRGQIGASGDFKSVYALR